MSVIVDTVQFYLPSKRKQTPSGWISFNAICCHNNGNTRDTRQRGGVNFGEGVSYHCFNCGFKASWTPGRSISIKFKKFLKWLNVPDDVISKCAFESLRLKEEGIESVSKGIMPTFVDIALPNNSVAISELLVDNTASDDLLPVLDYIRKRGLYLEDYDFYWSDQSGFKERLIIPFYFQNRLVGYTARKITVGKPKYISEQQPGYVFNLDNQKDTRQCVIVVEGPIDAISIDAVALTGSEINHTQKVLINKLQREVIVVPDRDKTGLKLIEQAIEAGWSVSMPDWEDNIKDVNDAVLNYGRLYTIYSILTSKESMPLKIRLHAKKWLKEPI